CPNGRDIKIEMRDKEELFTINGMHVTCSDYDAVAPAFDVTPAELITGIITDQSIYKYPYGF
ncbi:MAG: S-methyl-5-thioribose-1-phosphate isomerase, partial [Methanococcaceae archaeon]